jgi:RNA polymerase sigma factor (sigma-70 family)
VEPASAQPLRPLEPGRLHPTRRDDLFREFAPLVKGLLNRYGSDFESRRDLIGEIYWRFCRLVDVYDAARGVPFRAYIVRQLSAATHTHARKSWRRSGREVPLDEHESGAWREPASDPTPQWNEDLAAEQVRRALPEAICRLPRRQRQVLIWRYYEDKGFDEIAVALGIRPATARSLLRHGLNRLRESVHESGAALD